MSFAMCVLGLYSGPPVAACGRIRGVAASHYCAKKLHVQREPLAVQQVIMLERCVVSERAVVSDRLAAGFFLVCLYGRLRYSDALRKKSLRLDTVPDSNPVDRILEATCARAKTMTSLEHKTRLLPVAVSLCGPSVDVAGQWLRKLCGCVVLSWSAKFGLPHDCRRILGYHCVNIDRSMVAYSRDAMAKPLRRLNEVIQPDAARSGYFRARSGAECRADDAEDSSSSEGCADNEEPGHSDEERACNGICVDCAPRPVTVEKQHFL
eukprot:Skav208683  [mRNA]  locus=scaffold2658:52389:53279:- [translate_table: standard]